MGDPKSYPAGRPAKGDREPLDVSMIVGAARRLLETEGLHKLSTRRLAASLNVKSASLYYHVRNKEELMQLLSESICQEILLPSDALPWEDRLRELCSRYRTTLRGIRDSAEILLSTAPTTPRRLQIIDTVFRTVHEAGFEGKEIVMVASMINDYVISFALNEARIQQQGKLSEATHADASLFVPESTELPMLTGLSEHMVFNEDFLNEHFEFGLQVLFSGIKGRLQRTQ